jgi:hypothetical protein
MLNYSFLLYWINPTNSLYYAKFHLTLHSYRAVNICLVGHNVNQLIMYRERNAFYFEKYKKRRRKCNVGGIYNCWMLNLILYGVTATLKNWDYSELYLKVRFVPRSEHSLSVTKINPSLLTMNIIAV